MEYETKTYGKQIAIECEPPEQAANAMNYLLTGYCLAGKSLDGVKVKFLDGENAGKKAVFVTELYEIEGD